LPSRHGSFCRESEMEEGIGGERGWEGGKILGICFPPK